MSRIAIANCGSPWAQTFTYDAFGNISKSGTISFQPTYSYLTNRMTQIGSSTPTYDANGNVLNDTAHSYTWDVNGRPLTIDGVGLTYDGLGRMVEQDKGGVYTQIGYAPTGGKLAIMSGQTLQKAFVPLSGGAVAVYNSSGLAYYRHSDWLGSSRIASTPSRALYFDGAYAPFGENYAQIGTTDLSFTGMNQDTVSNLFDFPAREYNGIHGRWPSPDPAGMSSVHLRNPQTLNRYAFVHDSPLSFRDPTGMDGDPLSQCPDEASDPCVDAPSGGGGGDDGGPNAGNPDDGNPPDPTPPDPGNPDPGVTNPNQGDQNQCDSGNCQTATACNDSGCTNQTVMVVNGNDDNSCDGPCISESAQQILGQAGNITTPMTNPRTYVCWFGAAAAVGTGGGVLVGGEAIALAEPLIPAFPILFKWAYGQQGGPAAIPLKILSRVAKYCNGG
jgi:RHS repeat-associated protein